MASPNLVGVQWQNFTPALDILFSSTGSSAVFQIEITTQTPEPDLPSTDVLVGNWQGPFFASRRQFEGTLTPTNGGWSTIELFDITESPDTSAMFLGMVRIEPIPEVAGGGIMLIGELNATAPTSPSFVYDAVVYATR